MTLPDWLQQPWKLAPPEPDDRTVASNCLNRMFGRWKNGLQIVSAGQPLPKRLTDHVLITARDTRLETYLLRRFIPSCDERERLAAAFAVCRQPQYWSAIQLGYPLLPPDMAANAFTSLMAMYVLLDRKDLDRTDDGVQAMTELAGLAPRLVVLGKTASIASGWRKWQALTE